MENEEKMNIFTKKLLSILLAVSMVLPTWSVGNISAADINNISDPVYTVAKNMVGIQDAFVYAYNVMDYGADNQETMTTQRFFRSCLTRHIS